MDNTIDLTGFIAPAHAEGADADRLWLMRGAVPAPAKAEPLASIVRARQRLAEAAAQRGIVDSRERTHAIARRAELWAGWRRRRPLVTPDQPGGAA